MQGPDLLMMRTSHVASCTRFQFNELAPSKSGLLFKIPLPCGLYRSVFMLLLFPAFKCHNITVAFQRCKLPNVYFHFNIASMLPRPGHSLQLNWLSCNAPRCQHCPTQTLSCNVVLSTHRNTSTRVNFFCARATIRLHE